MKCESIKCKWAKNQIILEFQVPHLHKHSKHKLCYIPSYESSSKSCSYIMTSSPGCLAVPNAFPQNMIRSTVSSFETRHSFFFFLVNDYPITYLSPKIQRGVGGGGRREGLGDGQNLSLSLLSSQDE